MANLKSLVQNAKCSLDALTDEIHHFSVELIPYFCEEDKFKDHAFVFVHGYSFLGIISGKNQLQRNHDKITRRKDLLMFEYDVVKPIEQICEEFDKFLKENGDREYHPIGFSLGGLIVRNYVENMGGNKNIKRVALVATPNQGTRAAYLSHTKSGKQMRPGSKFLKNLNSKPLSIDYLNIWADRDELILPNKSAILNGAYNAQIVNKMHLSVLVCKRTYKLLNDFFERPTLQEYPKVQELVKPLA